MTRWWCRAYQPLLVDVADGALDPAGQQRLQQHLERCPRCRADLDALRDLPAVLQTSTVPDPGDTFWQQQRQAISRAIGNLPEPRASWQLGWPPDALQFSAWRYPIAATVALVRVVSVYQTAQRTPDAGGSSIAAHLAALDTESLVALQDLAAAVAPADNAITDLPRDDDIVLAAGDLVGVQPLSHGPDESELSDADIQQVDDLIGDIG